MTQYEVPEHGFQNFQAFFTRHVKPDARPIEQRHDEAVIVSPCDCRALFYSYNALYLESIRIKGQRFSFNELIGEELVRAGWTVHNSAFACYGSTLLTIIAIMCHFEAPFDTSRRTAHSSTSIMAVVTCWGSALARE